MLMITLRMTLGYRAGVSLGQSQAGPAMRSKSDTTG